MHHFNLSLTDLSRLAVKLVRKYKNKNIIIGLVGKLGAGKTTFVKNFGRALKIKKIKSPSFTILSVYNFNHKKLYHIDFYRLKKTTELEALGIKEVFEEKNRIVLIEWADRFPKILNQCDLILYFTINDNAHRNVTIKSN